MPGTLFAKMNLLMHECAQNPGLSVDEIAANVLQRGHYEFIVSKRVDDQIVQQPCQEATVRRAIYFLSDLGFLVINGGCSPSTRGSAALADFPNELGQAVLEYMQRLYGIGLINIRDAIVRVKMLRGADVPSAAQIHAQLESLRAFKQPITAERFSTLLNLLSRCGVLTSYFKKYYW